jgi:hypothetical protein
MPVPNTFVSPLGQNHGDRPGRCARIILSAAALLILGCSKINSLFPTSRWAFFPAETPIPAKTDSIPGNLAGTWHVGYSWGCGSFSETTWILHPDGTFFSPAIRRDGRWKAEGDQFALSFPYGPFVVYSGTIDATGKYMEGTMAGDDGSSGCWHAQKADSDSGNADFHPLPASPQPESGPGGSSIRSSSIP